DVVVLAARGGARLVEEALGQRGLARVQELDRDAAAELEVAGEEHAARPALADQLDQLVVVDPITGARCRTCGLHRGRAPGIHPARRCEPVPRRVPRAAERTRRCARRKPRALHRWRGRQRAVQRQMLRRAARWLAASWSWPPCARDSRSATCSRRYGAAIAGLPSPGGGSSTRRRRSQSPAGVWPRTISCPARSWTAATTGEAANTSGRCSG